jgi:outer membrane protein
VIREVMVLMIAVLPATAGRAQPSPTPAPSKRLTIADAAAMALQNHPRIRAAALREQAAEAVRTEVRAPLLPRLSASLTGVQADDGTSVASGNLTTSSLDTRLAAGAYLTQLLTDFGRTSSLVRSAGLRIRARQDDIEATRADVILNVRQAYFRALLSQSVLKVAQETLGSRQATFRQVNALFQSQMKSSIDLSFAEVNVSQAELDLETAGNDLSASMTQLSAAMGLEDDSPYELADEAMPPALSPDLEPIVREAFENRPDLASARHEYEAQLSFARSEHRLKLPTVNALGAGGVVPVRDERLHSNYGAIGFNVDIPFYNGGLFSARQAEADLRAQTAAEEVRTLEIRIRADVKVAWLASQTAFRRMGVSAKLVDQARRSARLVETRYSLGLGSIVELIQAQLSQTSAEIENTNAKYEYESARSALDYAAGNLR